MRSSSYSQDVPDESPGRYASAALVASELPSHHKDPFDRILIAQARVEGLTLLTADKTVAKYGKPVLKV